MWSRASKIKGAALCDAKESTSRRAPKSCRLAHAAWVTSVRRVDIHRRVGGARTARLNATADSYALAGARSSQWEILRWGAIAGPDLECGAVRGVAVGI